MEIHLVSSLTPDDESRLAPQLLVAIERILDRLPVTYSVRVETSAGNQIHRSHVVPPRGEASIPDEPIDSLGTHVPTT